MQYTDEELRRQHEVLYEIMAEIIRVCEVLGVDYFIQGGTAIGAFFEDAILPWDDDIDIGMTRENWTRFVEKAPEVIGENFFLQWVKTDASTPYYFAKMMKRNTLFVEEDFKHLNIEKGIFIDIFPFDKVPDNQMFQKMHRTLCNFLNCCFMGKSIWMWKHVRKCEISNPSNRGFLPCLATAVMDVLFSKEKIFRMLSWAQSLFNGGKHEYYNMVLMPRDHISVHSIENSELRKFGPLMVWAPSDLETYLRHHYPRLRRHIPKEEQQNHRPTYLSFDTTK